MMKALSRMDWAARYALRLGWRGGALKPKELDLLLRDLEAHWAEPPEAAHVLAFGSALLAGRQRSAAQLHQDLWVLSRCGFRREGWFVEFGAADGLLLSNTLLLEREYGWRGLCAEPDPRQYARLVNNRTAICDDRCVWSRSGETLAFSTVTDQPELSGITQFQESDSHAATRGGAATIEVTTVSLNDLLDEHAAPAEIDYMSVDTEGSELEVLQAFDFRRRSVRLLSVEHNRTTNEARIDGLMEDNGYRRVLRAWSRWDAWYVLP